MFVCIQISRLSKLVNLILAAPWRQQTSSSYDLEFSIEILVTINLKLNVDILVINSWLYCKS